MNGSFLAQAQNKTQTISGNTIISGSLIAAGAIMVGKARNDRFNELNQKLPFPKNINEELKKFAKGTQMRMMRESMTKEIKENVNKHSKSLMGFMTGFGLLLSGAALVLLNRNNKAEQGEEESKAIFDKEHITNSIKGAVEVGSLGYALGFALGVASSGISNLASGMPLDSDTIIGTIKNGHISGMGSAAMGMYVGSQKGLHKGSSSLHEDKKTLPLIEQNTLPKNLSFIEKVRRGKRQKNENLER